MRKDKRFTFFNEGKEICSIIVEPDHQKPFEVMLRRLLRYADRFSYNVQYQTEVVEQNNEESK